MDSIVDLCKYTIITKITNKNRISSSSKLNKNSIITEVKKVKWIAVICFALPIDTKHHVKVVELVVFSLTIEPKDKSVASVNAIDKSYNMHGAHIKSSFNGEIAEMPDISVDNFQDTTCKAYFLSHCHMDHTSGLFSEALLEHLKSNRVYIYMSEHSAAIIKHESCGTDIVEFIKPLQIGFSGTTTITVPFNHVTETEEEYLTVSLIPAGHCFGSVMFLFRTLYKTILYTGDFRMSTNSVTKYAQLHENGEIIKLDALYVDTTFFTDEHEDFPKRSESVDKTIQHIRAWLHQSHTNQVALHTSARYGYEFVFNQIHKQLGEKVYIGGDIWKLYSQFPNAVTGVTNDPTKSRIHLCRHRSEAKPHEDCLPNQIASKSAYLYIHFSALKWTGYKMEDAVIEVKKEANKYRIDVCFATHCSRSELEYFINYLSPEKVVGFPNEYVGAEKDPCEEEHIECAEKITEKVPKMLDENMMRELFED